MYDFQNAKLEPLAELNATIKEFGADTVEGAQALAKTIKERSSPKDNVSDKKEADKAIRNLVKTIVEHGTQKRSDLQDFSKYQVIKAINVRAEIDETLRRIRTGEHIDKRHKTLPNEVLETLSALVDQPLSSFIALYDPICRSVEATCRGEEATIRRRRILKLVQEELSQVRHEMKHMEFDLEVTKKERDALRDELED